MAHDVFISFSSVDKEIAEKVCDDLYEKGIKCWISSRGIRGGEAYQIAIVKALKDAAVMVLVFSSSANKSDQIIRELTLASQHQKHVIPVRIEDILPCEKYEYELAARQFIDLFKNWEKEIDHLAEDIRYVIGGARGNEEVKPRETADSLQVAGKTKEEKSDKEGPQKRLLEILLEKLKEEPLLKSLQFMGEKEIQTESRLRWMIKDKQGLGIRLKSWGETSSFRWGLFSENKKKDPEFHKLAERIRESGLFKKFKFFPKERNLIKLRIYFQTQYYNNEDLNKLETVEEIYQGFSDFCNKIEPFLNLSVIIGNGKVLAEEADKKSNKAGKVQTSDDPNIRLEDDTKQAAIEKSMPEETDEEDEVDNTLGKTRITYSSWDEFEKEQGNKDERKKANLPIAKNIHDFIYNILRDQNLNFNTRYGNGTFSFSLPKDKAKSGKRTFARVGLVDLAANNLYLDTLYKGEDEAIPAGGSTWSKKDQNKYQFNMNSLEDFEKVKDSIKEGVVRSYAYLAKS